MAPDWLSLGAMEEVEMKKAIPLPDFEAFMISWKVKEVVKDAVGERMKGFL